MNGYELSSPTVEQIGMLNITGDVVPPEFYRAIKFENGKPDLLAILILANVLYWYRPTRPRDEKTGRVLPWRQKFAGERLQRTYAEWAEMYGATDRMARGACARLKALGFLDVTCKANPLGGTYTQFEPIVEPIKALLSNQSRLTPERESETPTHVETGVGLHQNGSRVTSGRESSINKETTTKTSTESNMSPSAIASIHSPHNQVFDHWKAVLNHPKAHLDGRRERTIKARLKEGYTVEDLKQAIDGCKASPWHQGQNDQFKIYDDLELILRSASKVEQFMGYTENKGTQSYAKTGNGNGATPTPGLDRIQSRRIGG